ncbi:MAG: hypothetical protein R6U26_02975 [Candidatus Undinarchaeales archaeon]
MTKPNDYLKIWPQVVKNSIKYLKLRSNFERSFSMPAAFITTIAAIGHHRTLLHLAHFINANFNCLVRSREEIRISSFNDEAERLLYKATPKNQYRLKNGELPFKVHSSSKKVDLNDNGKRFIEGKLDSIRDLPELKNVKINLTSDYENLSNINKINDAISQIYSLKRRKLQYLKYCPIPKVNI